jgi:formate hydrogenlyase transcriptional activator
MGDSGTSVYVVDDDASVREGVAGLVRSAGLRAKTFASGEEFLASPPPRLPGCLVLDLNLPGLNGLEVQRELAKNAVHLPIIFLTGHGDIPTTVRAVKAGAVNFLTKPFDGDELLNAIRQSTRDYDQARRHLEQFAGPIATVFENALNHNAISQLNGKLAEEKLYLEEEIRSELGFERIIGDSSTLKHVLQMVETVAPSDSTVLLLGETGTGKELIARAIHEHSRRKDRAFVKLNCAAIPTGLLESELFGHEKGAFTGAIAQKIGRMELADQGTLFLDEVGDIPPEIQPKLLRALQEREFERLGSTHTRKANIRLVAATNRDLEMMIANREFRSDLYYRLNVFPIQIPPLRERREDIPLLTMYFVQKLARQMQKKIDYVPTRIVKALTEWDWPGNIRELENFIERAVILTQGRSLEAPLCELKKIRIDEPPPAPVHAPGGEQDIARIIKETIDSMGNKGALNEHAQKQREEIVRALAECKGRVGGPNGAAARMDIRRSTLVSRMKRFQIHPYQYA